MSVGSNNSNECATQEVHVAWDVQTIDHDMPEKCLEISQYTDENSTTEAAQYYVSDSNKLSLS